MDETGLRAQLEKLNALSYGWALHCCSGAAELAQDVLQSAYLKVLAGRARYDGSASFKTWLFAVIRMTAADERRRQWLRRLRLMRYQRECRPGIEAPDEGANQVTELAAFRQALARLSRRQQEVMHLVFYQDLSIHEASQVMGVSLGSARKHYERGKCNLRSWLEKSEHFNEYRRSREKTPTTL